MTDRFKLALATLNPVVGDIPGNFAKIRAARAEAARMGGDLVLTSELATCGYPPEDLVLKPAFQQTIHAALETLAAEDGPDIIISTPFVADDNVMSSVVLISGGKI